MAGPLRYASDLTVILDADGTITYESPAVERILGFRPEDRVGTSAFDHLHPDAAARSRASFFGPSCSTMAWPRGTGESGARVVVIRAPGSVKNTRPADDKWPDNIWTYPPITTRLCVG